jgi:hypothetical protein
LSSERRTDDSWLFTIGIIAEEATEMTAAVHAATAIVDGLGVRRTDRSLAFDPLRVQ